MRSRGFRIALLVLIVLMNIGCDQATKGMARSQLAGRGTMFLAGNHFLLHYVENEGAFLSLGQHLPRAVRTVVFIAFPLLVLGVMIGYILRKGLTNIVLLAGFSFVIGGGFGNLIDRITRAGRVSDFMILRNRWVSSGIFNFADLAILVGCLLLLASSLKEERGAHPPEAPAP
jgi:signal peptidase II